jgi:hypothetical protein
LVLVTGALALYTARLFHATKKLAEDARETSDRQHAQTEASLLIARQSADAAKDGAEATHASVAQMKDTAERQLRAYLTRTSGPTACREVPGRDPGPEQGHRFEFILGIKNCGATPAYRVVSVSACEIALRQQPPSHDVLWPHPRPSNASLGPGQQMSMVILSESITRSQVQQVKNGADFRLFVFGIVTYEDTFGHRRTLKFREEVEWRHGDLRLYPTDGGNESD